MMLDLLSPGLRALAVVLLVFYISSRFLRTPKQNSPPPVPTENTKKAPKSIMQPPNKDLAPAQHTPYTSKALQEYDGRDPLKPIYVAIKGTIFDVSLKAEVYGPGKSYNVFAGKDGSKGLGKSSLKPEDAVADYSGLDEKEMKVLNDWHDFFSKRYNVVGRVVDTVDRE